MRLFLAVCLFLGLYLSCEDSKTPKTQPTTTVVVKDTIQAPKEVATPAEKGTPQNPFIASQAELKGFLKTYGEENPETKIRIETRFGNIDVTLFKDTPLHRANFLLLAKNEYLAAQIKERNQESQDKDREHVHERKRDLFND